MVAIVAVSWRVLPVAAVHGASSRRGPPPERPCTCASRRTAGGAKRERGGHAREFRFAASLIPQATAMIRSEAPVVIRSALSRAPPCVRQQPGRAVAAMPRLGALVAAALVCQAGSAFLSSGALPASRSIGSGALSRVVDRADSAQRSRALVLHAHGEVAEMKGRSFVQQDMRGARVPRSARCAAPRARTHTRL